MPAKLAGTNWEMTLALVAFAAGATVAVDRAFPAETRMAVTRLCRMEDGSVERLLALWVDIVKIAASLGER